MKKAYTKPEILFEDFSLSTCIAVTCTYKTDLQTIESSCGWSDPRNPANVLFVQGMTGCPNGPANDNICYHVPDGIPNVFGS